MVSGPFRFVVVIVSNMDDLANLQPPEENVQIWGSFYESIGTVYTLNFPKPTEE